MKYFLFISLLMPVGCQTFEEGIVKCKNTCVDMGAGFKSYKFGFLETCECRVYR